MKTDTPKQPAQRGPAPTDIALLTRNRLWAWLVLACTPEVTSWDALDAHWLAQIDGGTPTQGQWAEKRGRRKVFLRYFHVGNDPGKLQGLNGKKLLDVVHADPRQRAAKALYDSPMWELAALEAPSLDRVCEIHASLLKRLGLACLTPTQRVVARISRFTNVAGDNLDLRNIAENAHNVGELASVDAMALLACSFRLALDTLSLKEAGVYLDALRWSLRRFLIRWHAHGPAGKAIATLVDVRLLRRSTAPVSPELLGFKIRRDRRHGEAMATFESYWPPSAMLTRGESPYTSPIVPMDRDLETFFRHFETNVEALREQILRRLSDKADTNTTDQAADPGAIRQRRIDLINDMLLGPLNSNGLIAFEMLDHLSRFRALGGITSILDDYFNPNVDKPRSPER